MIRKSHFSDWFIYMKQIMKKMRGRDKAQQIFNEPEIEESKTSKKRKKRDILFSRLRDERDIF